MNVTLSGELGLVPSCPCTGVESSGPHIEIDTSNARFESNGGVMVMVTRYTHRRCTACKAPWRFGAIMAERST